MKFLDENGLLYFTQKIMSWLNNKVDKVDGKGLSTNDFTAENKLKLDGIETGAQVNVQPDWNQTNSSAIDYIKNKPSAMVVDSELSNSSTNSVQNKVIYSALNNKVDKISGKGLSTNDFTATYKLTLDTLENTYAKKTDITSMYKHKGSKATVNELPVSGNTAGDVWNVTSTGMNYVWTGTEWDALGEVFTVESISNSDIDIICAS